jgi:hypothetical protein
MTTYRSITIDGKKFCYNLAPPPEKIFSQQNILAYIKKYQLGQHYQKCHKSLPFKILSSSDIFSPDNKFRTFARTLVVDLLWSSDTQKYCIEIMNGPKWPNNGIFIWLNNLDLIEEELLSPVDTTQYERLVMIFQFVAQFTTDSEIYDQCLEIAEKLRNQRMIHLMAFNKKFKSKHTAFPEKPPGLNRIKSFNPGSFFQPINNHLAYWSERIVYAYFSLSKDCNKTTKLVTYVYLLNSLVEYNKLTKNLGPDEKEIDLEKVFTTLEVILGQALNGPNRETYNTIYEDVSKFIISLDKKNSLVVTESDILQKPKSSQDIKLLDLIDISLFNLIDKNVHQNDIRKFDWLYENIHLNNETEVRYIISEVCNHVSDDVYNDRSKTTSSNKELIEAFVFLSEKDMISLDNYLYLIGCATENKNQWILDNYKK